MEVIVGVERRRRWRPDEKLRILAELDEPGATFAEVARRHEISRGLLWQWRDAQRRGVLVAEETSFLPVRVVPEPPLTATSSPAPAEVDAEPDDNRIEILLPDGTALRVPETISAAILRRLLTALRR
jgi:transposase